MSWFFSPQVFFFFLSPLPPLSFLFVTPALLCLRRTVTQDEGGALTLTLCKCRYWWGYVACTEAERSTTLTTKKKGWRCWCADLTHMINSLETEENSDWKRRLKNNQGFHHYTILFLFLLLTLFSLTLSSFFELKAITAKIPAHDCIFRFCCCCCAPFSSTAVKRQTTATTIKKKKKETQYKETIFFCLLLYPLYFFNVWIVVAAFPFFFFCCDGVDRKRAARKPQKKKNWKKRDVFQGIQAHAKKKKSKKHSMHHAAEHK